MDTGTGVGVGMGVGVGVGTEHGKFVKDRVWDTVVMHTLLPKF